MLYALGRKATSGNTNNIDVIGRFIQNLIFIEYVFFYFISISVAVSKFIV